MGAKYHHSGSFLGSLMGHHKEAIVYSLAKLWQSNLSTWITLAAIAIALCLPASLHLLLQNLKSLTDDKREVPTISLFIKQDISEQRARDRGELLEELSQIDKVVLVPRDEALKDFRKITGFAETLETLDENPLPHVLVVTPHINLIGNPEEDMEKLAAKLNTYPEIDLVQMDIEWVRRLRSILRIAERAIFVISALLALTVLLVIGNTIRLNIENRKEEIKVSKLIGATAAYIRRPFLYTGVWYGLFGGVMSLVLVHLALLWFVGPVNELARLYGSTFVISGLSVATTFFILFASSLLGLVGAWIAVGSHLRSTKLEE
ncbi:permease-like cell division protein FtsX [uncultured Cocleimonas sp.]|uniref:permease-like cell division protein FtsX n=1 Tax=uncultured Cocleimonas sp. TaxID=1051587 RepID=UPI0026325C63|nr:permease-like cell division protein FtsX [uncultured Cocleimonas sp.]